MGGICIDLGLERYLYGQPPEACFAMLDALVPLHAAILRDIVVAPPSGRKTWLARARICEATSQAKAHWLAPAKAKPILEDLDKLYKAKQDSVEMPYDDAEPANLQDLMFTFKKRPSYRVDVVLGPGLEVRADDLASIGSWAFPKGSVAAKLVAIAKKHKLILHSA